MAEEVINVRRGLRGTASPTRRDLLTVFFRQRRLFFWSFIVVFAGCLAYGIASRSYRAEMKVLLRRGRLDVPMSAEPSTMPLRYDVTEEEFNSEGELIRDLDTLRAVAVAVHLDDRVGWRPWGNTPEGRLQRATHRLSDALKVEPLRKTRLLRVSYQSSDAEMAANVLKSLAAVYREKQLLAHRPSGQSAFFEQQAAEARERIASGDRQLLRLINRGSVEPGLQRDIALQKLADADSNYKQQLVSMEEATERIRALQQQLKALPERTITTLRAADNPQLMERLKSTLLTLELRRTELLTRFHPEYRLVREVDEQIEHTKAAIAGEGLRPMRDETSSLNQQYEWAKSELEKAEVELQGLQARAAGTLKLVGDYQALSRHLGQDTLVQRDLLRETKNAEESYVLLAKKREEARIGDALDDRQVLNAIVVQPPVVPAYPSRSPIELATIGLLLAGVMSTGLAFASDALDPTFRVPDEVARYLDSPVLASLPAEWNQSRTRLSS